MNKLCQSCGMLADGSHPAANPPHWSATMKIKQAKAKHPAAHRRKAAPTPVDDPAITLRPDGYYWQAIDGHQEFGPFATLELARADMDAFSDDGPAPGESLEEAENEIGIAAWIDPETGQPAEGLSPPHLDET